MYIRYSEDKIKQKDLSEVIDQIYYLDPDVKKVERKSGYLIIHYEGIHEKVFLKQLEAVLNDRERTIKKVRLADNLIHPIVKKEVSQKVNKEVIFRLHECIKKMLDEISRKFKGSPARFSTLMDSELMERSKYAYHFPQNIYRIAEIRHQKERLDEYRINMEKGHKVEDLFEVNSHFLRPCLCYFAYDERKDQSFDRDLEVIYSYGSCYRHEHDKKISAHRSRDFTMYEIIYLGSKEKVENLRKDIIQEVWELFNRIGLRGYIETANDPFFIKNDRNRIAFQRAAEMKYELIFSPNEDLSFSIGSFNLVGEVLTQSFGIKGKQGENVSSGCTAFGVDRWVEAILYTFGDNLENWPTYLRERIGDEK
ncbi:tRNA synthetase class II core domain (G, H, P, S and T) [Fictibacillus solisalsi]|uniref:tRNA synthetase class II core domain (G, H, P, S and T) n=1 Tax=Fictibacillus solisalsi TaxID=459525 RepID=A0A1H0BST4_9BACL|nr:aminoacyl--tRNA ligase-related protein [Fictibacillus solisalsi]SDN48712.1 tRNA synthetase class II core domain (G, H, P, S and T) [Fictibacillus solisalsi]